jgi:hypothetical protein
MTASALLSESILQMLSRGQEASAAHVAKGQCCLALEGIDSSFESSVPNPGWNHVGCQAASPNPWLQRTLAKSMHPACTPHLCIQGWWEYSLVQHLAQQLQGSLHHQLAVILQAPDGCMAQHSTARHSTSQRDTIQHVTLA